MLKNYLKVTLRNLRRNQVYSFITISGLAIGMACCIVIMLYVQHELSYDKFHENADNIYRIAAEKRGDERGSSKTYSWIAPNIVNEYPEVITAVRMLNWGGTISYNNKHIDELPLFADPALLDVFSFPLERGDKSTALKDPGNALVSEELAEKLFGEENPIGKVVILDGTYDFKITGVLTNIPHNSHLRFNFLTHYEHTKNIYGEERYKKNRIRGHTYLLLRGNASSEELSQKFHDFVVKYKGKTYALSRKYFFQPLTSIHLNSHLIGELSKNNTVSTLYALSGIAILILSIACINFMNLSTARASRRSKEVGLRKVVGAKRTELFRQFIGESLCFSFISLFFALLLAQLFLPFFNSIINKQLEINFSNNLYLYIGLLLLTLVVGFSAGSYPGFYLSSFQPVDTLKGKLKKGLTSEVYIKKGLVVFQFALSLVFIIGTLIVVLQMNFVQKRDLGFKKDSIVTVSGSNLYSIYKRRDEQTVQRFENLKIDLLRNPDIYNVSLSGGLPGTSPGVSFSVTPEDSKNTQPVSLNLMEVDNDFFEVFGIDIIDGRNFSETIASDVESAFILNESAVRALGWESPVGKEIINEREGINGRVIGVVKDFHNASLHSEIQPSVFQIKPAYYSIISARINPDEIKETLSFTEQKWYEYFPFSTFSYSFHEDNIERLYREERRVSRILTFSSFLTIFLACLGLFGLGTFSAEMRIKEVGIRKVLGARVSQIIYLISSDFLKLVLLANIIAWPLAYFLTSKWLQNFSYRITINVWMFLAASALVFVISILTVSYQTVKAAVSNPVETLRYE